jgi:hypothetical protein
MQTMLTRLTRSEEELHSLTVQLQALLADIPLKIQCICRDSDLVILGQHHPDLALDTRRIFHTLERQIQAFQIQCARQVRLYLRTVGDSSPYASRQFAIQPPPPPPLLNPGASLSSTEEKWLLDDEDIDAWLHEVGTPGLEQLPLLEHGTRIEIQDNLTNLPTDLRTDKSHDLAVRSPSQFESAMAVANAGDTPERAENLSLVPYSAAEGEDQDVLHSDLNDALVTRQQGSRWNARWAIVTGAATLGLAGGTYLVTRPCSLNTCPELQTARSLEQNSLATLQQGNTPDALAVAHQSLGRAVAVLETIPLWSSRRPEAAQLMESYQAKAETLEQLLHLETQVSEVLPPDLNQPRSVEDWQTIRAALIPMIGHLSDIGLDQSIYPYARRQLAHYRAALATVERQLQREQQAQAALDNAQQTVKLAETRQAIARSLENWQLVRATWQVVMMRLEDIPSNTLAVEEASQLREEYQPKLDAANQQVDAEQLARNLLEQGKQRAAEAQSAQTRFHWRQALVDWEAAIAFLEEIPQGTSKQSQVQTLLATYQQSRDQAQQKLEATAQVASQLDQLCQGEIQLCTLLAVDQSIRLQLGQSYVAAIEAARSTGNRDLQAIVTEHQLNLRRAFVAIATEFDLPVEVYSPSQALLDRHLPEEG